VTSFINSIRLKEACRIMRQRPDIKMSELSMSVGFNTPKYFTKLFKREFGVLPSEFIEQK
jgi:AraC-like DNA-binding protein